MHTNHRPVTVIEPPSLTAFRPVRALRRLAGARDLLWTLSAHRLSVRYKQTRLGVAWAICSRAQSCWRSVVFALLGGAPSDGVPYPLFAYAALVPWSAFASGLANSTTSLTGHAALVTRVSFPREILPLTYVLAAMTDALLASVVLTGLMAWYGIAPTMAMGWAVAALVLLALWLAGAGLLFATMHVRHRDIGLAVPVLLQVWMFATPVVYPLSLAREQFHPFAYALYTMNPMAGIVDAFRTGALLGTAPDPHAFVTAVVVVVLVLPIAYASFKQAEATMADVV